MKRIAGLFAIVIFVMFSWCAKAGPVLTEVMETMMESQAHEALFIGTIFGVDNSARLNFSSNTDPQHRLFSFSTLPNQSYRGLDLALTTSGSFDQLLSKYFWSSIGSLGSQTWVSTGSVEWIGDPTGIVPTNHTFTLPGGNHPITVRLTGNVTWEQGPVNALSTGTYMFEELASGGMKWGPFSGRDRFDVIDQQWIHSVDVGKSNVTPDGIATIAAGFLASADGGAGGFNIRILQVPEPGSFSLLLIALFAMRRHHASKGTYSAPTLQLREIDKSTTWS